MDTSKIKFIQHVRELIPFEASPEVLDFVACQFALESAFGTSSLARNCQNYCGMKRVWSRITSQIPFVDEDNDFGWYNSLYECVIDYSLWLAFNKANKNVLSNLAQFKEFIVSHHYCDDVDYISSISNLLNSYKNAKE